MIRIAAGEVVEEAVGIGEDIEVAGRVEEETKAAAGPPLLRQISSKHSHKSIVDLIREKSHGDAAQEGAAEEEPGEQEPSGKEPTSKTEPASAAAELPRQASPPAQAEEALQARRARLGNNYPATLISTSSRAMLLQGMGELVPVLSVLGRWQRRLLSLSSRVLRPPPSCYRHPRAACRRPSPRESRRGRRRRWSAPPKELQPETRPKPWIKVLMKTTKPCISICYYPLTSYV